MADIPLFVLDAEGRWRLAYDSLQWVIQRRVGSPRPSVSGAVLKSGWQAVSFVRSKKATLDRLFREKVINLTTEAEARFDALPERFFDYIATPEGFLDLATNPDHVDYAFKTKAA